VSYQQHMLLVTEHEKAHYQRLSGHKRETSVRSTGYFRFLTLEIVLLLLEPMSNLSLCLKQ
jgi:hypothetical protein